jgi:hypothetical protein
VGESGIGVGEIVAILIDSRDSTVF